MADAIKPFIDALKDKANLAEERGLDLQAEHDHDLVSAADADEFAFTLECDKRPVCQD